jgi:hypothetical protein
MRKERTLANIAETAFWNAESENKNTFDRVAKAVEKEVLERRVARKKVNDPDDLTTWEKGVAIFRRDMEDAIWILDVFGGYSLGSTHKYRSEHGVYKYAKLATPEQIEAWKLINDDAEYAL